MCFLFNEKVDFVLSPAAAGNPKPFIPGDVKRFEKMILNSRSVFAKTLGVPVVMANRVGILETELPGKLPYLKTNFPVLSSIVDSDGTVKAELKGEEGIIVSDICIETNDRPTSKPAIPDNAFIPLNCRAYIFSFRKLFTENYGKCAII